MPTSSSTSLEANQNAVEPGFAPIERGPTELRAFLRFAVRVTSALAALHSKDIIHRNIRRSTVLVNSETGEVRLAGSRDSFATGDAKSADPNDTLPYTSPEQTEGMKRPVDHRADLYSLGITLFEALTGTLPLHGDDPLGWVQAHLTKAARDPREAVPGTPDAVADILLRLMNKTVEDRYQSARGLLIDLETCLVELEQKGKIEPFPLGARDVWHGLRISAKLYGREKESAELLAAFDRVLISGTREIALVSGYSGVGKSSLVQELHKPIVRERGYFLAGKFDQHKRNIPYVTIAQAFREVVHQILGESEAQIQSWKERMLEALGTNGQLIVDVIPQVEQIIGKQPPVAPLAITDAQNRFNNVFRRFIGLFARKEHPLALFLDDLQYADFATLKLLQHLLTHTDNKYLFVLGAYRDNEVSPSHPAMMTLDEMQKQGVFITSLVLKPLDIENLTHLVADTFHCDHKSAEPLARLLHAKTGGNPFFANQFLAELHHENLVHFDVDKASWHWSTAAIEAKQFTDDVVELMADKLRRLPGETQAALQLAACIGSEIDVQMLEMTHDKTAEETYEDLDHAVRAEFMLRRGNMYKFLHDRVHQAAYSLIPEEQRSWVHLRIGRLLLERTPEADRDERAFDIVNQFNIGQAYITDPEEQAAIARLNLTAGRKAKASVAFHSAVTYLRAGLALLSEDSWTSQPELTREIHFELAEAEFLTGNFAETERLCEVLLKHTEHHRDKEPVYRLLMFMNIVQGPAGTMKALQIGLDYLKVFGIDLPLSPTNEDVFGEFVKAKTALAGRPIEELLDLPLMTDPDVLPAMMILTVLALAAFYAAPLLFPITTAHLVQLSIKHGNTAASAFGYAAFAVVMGPFFGEYADAYRLGKVGYDFTERHGILSFKAQVCCLYGGMVSIYVHHMDENVETTRIGYQAAIESGNNLYGCFQCLHLSSSLLFRGEPLETLHDVCLSGTDFVTNSGFLYMNAPIQGIDRLAQAMRGKTVSLSSLNGEGFDEAEFEAQLAMSIPFAQCWYYITKLQARYLAGAHEDAVSLSISTKPLLPAGTGFVTMPEYQFYAGLAAAAVSTSAGAGAGDDRQKECKEILAESLAKLDVWRKNCAANYADRYLLVAGESARIEGRADEALRLFAEAIQASQESRFTQNVALGHELAGRLLVSRGDAAAAMEHLRKARAAYATWGAFGKVKQLEEQHPGLDTSI